MTMIAGLMRYVFWVKKLRGFAAIWSKKASLKPLRIRSKNSQKPPKFIAHNADYVKYTKKPLQTGLKITTKNHPKTDPCSLAHST